jgi:hypothetical protein
MPVPAQQLVPPEPVQAPGQELFSQPLASLEGLTDIGRHVVARLDAMVDSLAQFIFLEQPQPAFAEVPVPATQGGHQAGPINFSPSIEINVTNSDATADDIADRVRLAFNDMLSDAEASVRSFLSD